MLCARTDNGKMICVRDQIGNYMVSKEIGKGSSCIVLEAIEIGSGRKYAIKAMKRSLLSGDDLLVNIDKEINVIQSLHHKNIAECKEVIHQGEHIYIVMEHCGNHNLLDLIVSGAFTANPERLLKIFYQICEAIKYLHERGIAHGDIKPENVMITNDDTAKLTDFGYCHTSVIGSDEEKGGTVYYAGPEMFVAGNFNTQSADIWSLGILLFVMHTGAFPFAEEEDPVEQILSDRLTYPLSMRPDFSRLCRWMSTFNPNARPGIEDVMADRIFESIDSKKRKSEAELFSMMEFDEEEDEAFELMLT